MLNLKGLYTNAKVFTENIEDSAISQIITLLNQEAFKDSKIRIMPDVHAGKGCTIGFTADLGNKVIPNIVGVDIGCGMLCIKLLNKDIDLEELNNNILEYVPSGSNVHANRVIKFPKLQELKCYRELKDTKRIERSLGTLGGGNHFIEIDRDLDGNNYLVIHTGSRNLGKQVAEYYQNLAIELMQGKDELIDKRNTLILEYTQSGKKSDIQLALKELNAEYIPKLLNIPKELCYLTGQYREDYLNDMNICQNYASENRDTIARIIMTNSKLIEVDRFETIHNYVDVENNIVRKGAVSAKKGEKLLIPINMRDGCIIGIGKGNDDWNQSAPHGAGRLMSRTVAKNKVTLTEFQDSMGGIFSTSIVEDTIDESPMAYKNMDEIVENIKDTVSILEIIKPIYNFKSHQ